MYPKTKAAYLSFAGQEGKKLVKIYEEEYNRIMK
jgi:hypothetical protein